MKKIIDQAKELAINEIKKFGVPKMEHFVLANEKGQQLATTLDVDRDIVLLGTILMDLKIGQCLKESRLQDHMKESSAAAQEFLEKFNLGGDVLKKIISCIESHHGAKPYFCKEAEICANADCYRFLSPEGFFHGLLIFGRRFSNLDDSLASLEEKLEEKHKILSLDICKQELVDYYINFKNLIQKAKRN